MSVPEPLIPIPRHPRDDTSGSDGELLDPDLPAKARSLLNQAENCLHTARRSVRSGDRYVAAHLAALRAATAVVLTRSRNTHTERPVSVWTLLTDSAPELRWWGQLFAAGTERRAAAEAGVHAVSDGDANALVHRSEEFVRIVRRSLTGVRR